MAEMRWISFKLAYDLARLLYIFWFFEWKMTKNFQISTLNDKVNIIFQISIVLSRKELPEAILSK